MSDANFPALVFYGREIQNKKPQKGSQKKDIATEKAATK
jgi:hypothetical protein